MKWVKKFVFLAVVASIATALCFSANAADVEDGQAEALEIEEIEKSVPQSAKDMLGDINIQSAEDAGGALAAVKDAVVGSLKDIFGDAAKAGLSFVAVALLTGLVTSICPPDSGKYASYVEFAGAVSVAALAVDGTGALMTAGSEMIGELYAFSKALLPTLSAAAAAGGAVSSAAAQYAAAAVFMDVILTVETSLMLPLVYGYFLTSVCGAALDNSGVQSAAKMIKWTAVTLLSASVLALTVYLMVSGVVLGTADDAAVKLAKTAISTALPVIGSIAADASGAVVAGINTLKNILGVFGLIVIIAVCAVPILKLAAFSIVVKVASAFTAALGNKKLSGAIDAVSSAYALILGICGSAGIALFVSVIAVLRTVTG